MEKSTNPDVNFHSVNVKSLFISNTHIKDSNTSGQVGASHQGVWKQLPSIAKMVTFVEISAITSTNISVISAFNPLVRLLRYPGISQFPGADE